MLKLFRFINTEFIKNMNNDMDNNRDNNRDNIDNNISDINCCNIQNLYFINIMFFIIAFTSNSIFYILNLKTKKSFNTKDFSCQNSQVEYSVIIQPDNKIDVLYNSK